MCLDNDGKSTRAIHVERGVIYDAIVLSREYLPLGPGERQARFKEMVSRYHATILSRDPNVRGSGATARCMLLCPRGAVFVWCNGNRNHPKRVAEYLMRQDLTIETPDWVLHGKWAGIQKAVRFDHAFGDASAMQLTAEHWIQYDRLKAYLRTHDLDG